MSLKKFAISSLSKRLVIRSVVRPHSIAYVIPDPHSYSLKGGRKIK